MSGANAQIFAVLTAISLSGASGAGAGTAVDFTFKRVTVGTQPLGGRIDVQIAPEEDYYKNQNPTKSRDSAVADPAGNPSPVAPDLSAWFWDGVSTTVQDASSERLAEALAQLRRDPAKMAAVSPNLAALQKLVADHGTKILLATLGKKVSPALVLAVLAVESSGRVDAVSSAGAVGLMQLIPDTAKRFDVADSSDPQQNLNGGAAYLDWLLKEFKRDPLLVLAGYNAGENAVKKYGGVPPFPETRAYVPKVVAAWQVARALCMTPPTYVTDGCVFTTQGKK